MAILPVPIFVVAALFIVRGYTLESHCIVVRRLFGETRLPLRGLKSATYEPGSTRWSLRMGGIGGLFSISGRFYNRKLGSYRALLTDPRRAVVLRYKSKTVVISPDDPSRFVDELELVLMNKPQ